MDFTPLPFEKEPSFSNTTITSDKADGRAWKYDDESNVWKLVDVATSTFDGVAPVIADVVDNNVTYSIDLDRILPVPPLP